VRKALVAIVTLQLLVWLLVWAWARTPSSTPLSPDERAAVMARLRAAVDRAAAPPAPLPSRALLGPVFAALFVDGAPAVRVEARAPTLAAAVEDAAAQLRAATLSDDARRRGRLAVDVTRARAPIASAPAPLFALSIVPGIDGIGARLGDRDAWLTVDELMRADALAATQPVPGVDFEIGADLAVIRARIAAALAVDVAALEHAHWFRFRADSFVEPANSGRRGQALPVARGLTPGPSLSADALRAAAVAGGHYLLRHLYEDGRFGYEYEPATDRDEAYGLDYSLPRHAGATYYLAQLYGATGDRSFGDGAARALAFLSQRHPGACNRADRACVGNGDIGYVDLGAAAMSLLATVEYARVTGEHSFDVWAHRLARFLLYMQKASGDFCHLFQPFGDRRDETTKMLYFSGEAAFALAKTAAFYGPTDPDYRRWVEALDRALTFLTVTQYDNLAGQFYFGEDHWTCMAADSGWDVLLPAHRAGYARFCDQFVAFLRRTQFRPDEAITRAQPDFAGAYGLSPFIPPHATPVGSRSETTLSTYHMQERRGRPDPATREQIRAGMQFLLAHQIRDDDTWLMQNPDAARGGFLMSDVKRYIRIDFIQHSCSAMLRAIPALWPHP
jgi:hypothetical protein